MKNDLDREMFGEFDFMYRHKADLKKKEEEEKANTPPPRPEPEPEKEKPEEKKRPPEKKKKKTVKKIHPEYGKPYKKDTPKDRRPLVDDGGKKLREQYKREKSTTEHEKHREDVAAERSLRRMNFTRLGVLALAGTLVAVILAAAAICALFVALNYRKDETHLNVVYQIGGSDSAKRVSYEKLIRDGTPYVCGNDIASLCGFTVTGSGEKLKYISPDKGNDTVLFEVGTYNAEVNKTFIRLSAKTYYEDGMLYIPLDFFTDYATGIVCSYKPETVSDDGKTKKRAEITVYKNVLNESAVKLSGASPVYEPVTFRIKQSTTIDKIDESEIDPSLSDMTYMIDVSYYEQFIAPAQPYSYITAVNSKRPFTADAGYSDLVSVAQNGDEEIFLRKNAAMSLEALLAEAKAYGFTGFSVLKGYQPYDPDSDNGEYVLGLTADIYDNEVKLRDTELRMYEWLSSNAYKFGFIIRYQEDKTKATGEPFKPFTVRYVGRYAAVRMFTEKLCLEEFIDTYGIDKFMN